MVCRGQFQKQMYFVSNRLLIQQPMCLLLDHHGCNVLDVAVCMPHFRSVAQSWNRLMGDLFCHRNVLPWNNSTLLFYAFAWSTSTSMNYLFAYHFNCLIPCDGSLLMLPDMRKSSNPGPWVCDLGVICKKPLCSHNE